MKKYQVGKRAPVFVKHWWDERGYFAWDVYMIGDCLRYIEESSAGSYEKVQECSDDDMYGKITGFSCRRRSFENMASILPLACPLAGLVSDPTRAIGARHLVDVRERQRRSLTVVQLHC